jgi:hypothetical protein
VLAPTVTFRDLLRSRLAGQFVTGVDGFNLVYSVTPGTFVDFIDGVVPVLQARGLVQRAYAPGPLRQKIFGQAAGASSCRGLPPRLRIVSTAFLV